MIKTFEEMLKDSLEPTGFPAMPGIIQGAKLEMQMYARVDPHDMLRFIRVRCSEGDVTEFVCGADTHMRTDDSATMDSGVIVFHARRGEPTRVGVWEYEGLEHKGAINWDNVFWSELYADLRADMAKWVSGDE